METSAVLATSFTNERSWRPNISGTEDGPVLKQTQSTTGGEKEEEY